MKGKKRKKREENYDREEEVEEMERDDNGVTTADTQAQDEKVVDDLVKDMPGIPITSCNQSSRSGAIFILEKASLEVAKVGKVYLLLDDGWY